ncbi:hypothetical protein ACQ4M3_13120 [Leptolyngbya sp. AN03gr2]|uniref:hypothetical protein n=1 Tax=unclassified Leptolyngbya TaxID=2650499 RepID=UPI003D31E384
MPPHPNSEALKTARGKRFVALLKQVYTESAPELAASAQAIIEAQGKLTIVDVGVLALQFNLQLKHASEFLEEQGVLPCGTYDRLKARNLKVSDIMRRAALRVTALDQPQPDQEHSAPDGQT